MPNDTIRRPATPAIDTPVIVPELVAVLDGSNLPAELGTTLATAFQPHFLSFQALRDELRNVIVLSPADARKARLALKAIRVASKHTHEAQKAEILSTGRVIDRINAVLLEHLAPIEKQMDDIEKAEERRAAAVAAQLVADRSALIAPYGDPKFYSLGNIPEDSFQQLLQSLKDAHEARLAAEAKAEQERQDRAKAETIAREQRAAEEKAERERLQAENVRLAKVAAEERAIREAQDLAQRAERDRIELERTRERAEEFKRAKLEKAEADAREEAAREQARIDRQAREKVEAELNAKIKQEADRKAKAAADAKRLARAPEKDRLLAYAKAIRALPIPTITDPALSARIAEQQSKFAAWIDAEAGKI